MGVLSLGAVGCTDDGSAGPDATLTVVNESDFVIEEIFLTEVNDPDWGPNLLAGDALFPDEEITLGAFCGRYDALLVDEDGVECELNNQDLCLNDAVWVIRNNTCTVFGAAREQREQAATTGQAPAPATAK